MCKFTYLLIALNSLFLNLGLSQHVQVNPNHATIKWSFTEKIDQDTSKPDLFFQIVFAETNTDIVSFGNTMLDAKNPGKYSRLLKWDKNSPLVAVGVDGTHLEVPEGDHSFSFPRAVADTTGNIHLLWGEGTTQSGRKTFTTIKYSKYEQQQKEWSTPQDIHHGNDIDWAPNRTSDFFRASDGTIQIMVESLQDTLTKKGVMRQINGTVQLYKNSNGWQKRFWTNSRARTCAYIDFIVDAAEKLHIACVGPSFETPNDQNSVFYVSTKEDVKKWEKPTLINLSGADLTRATKPAIRFTPDSTLHLIWGQSLNREILPETFGHAYSTDKGETWNEVNMLDSNVPGSIVMQDLVVDSTGTIHLVYSTRENLKKYHTYYRSWDGTRWSSEIELYPEENLVLYGKLFIDSKGKLLLPVVQFAMTERSSRSALPVGTHFLLGEKKNH